MVENLVGIELAYINTKHPDFHEAGLIHQALTGGEYVMNTPKHDNRVSFIKIFRSKNFVYIVVRLMMNR